MSQNDEVSDDVADALLGGSAYERICARRGEPFPLGLGLRARILGLAGVLGALSLVLPLFRSFPASTMGYLGSTDPALAAPKVLVLGVYGGVMVLVAAALLLGVGVVRLRRGPLDEDAAWRAVDVETLAGVVGFGLGGVSVAVTVAFFLLGALGGVGEYVQIADGINPFEAALIQVPVAYAGIAAFGAALVVWIAGQYVTVKLECRVVPDG